MNRRLLILASAVWLAGCVTRPVSGPEPGFSGPLAELETVHGFRAGPDGVSLSLTSGGCTDRTDIVHYIERRGREFGLAIARKRLDRCVSAPGTESEIHFTYQDLGLPPGSVVFLLNPIGPSRP